MRYAGDVDRDGDFDVLSASLNDNRIAWHENTAGNGDSWTMRTIATIAIGASTAMAMSSMGPTAATLERCAASPD